MIGILGYTPGLRVGSAHRVVRTSPGYRGQPGIMHVAETIARELLEILRCPESHAPLIQSGDWLYSTDPQTRRRFPIRDGIPIMLLDESEKVDEPEFRRVIESKHPG